MRAARAAGKIAGRVACIAFLWCVAYLPGLAADAGHGDAFTYTKQCSACEEGKYCFENNLSPCPDHSNSDALSSALSDCICKPGYRETAGGQCLECVAGEFCENEVVTQCTSLANGAHTTSAAGSSLAAHCVCEPGFTRESDGSAACVPCAPGTYKPGNGDGTCTPCGTGTYSLTEGAQAISTCQACPAFTQSDAGSGTLQSCVCLAGYTGEDGVECSACGPGTFKSLPGSAACSDCADGAGVRRRLLGVIADAPHSDSVYWSSASACTAHGTCCQTCPAKSRVPGGSSGSQQSDCLCFEGYTLDGAHCTPCAAGTFKTTLGSSECSECAAGKYNTEQAAYLESHCLDCPALSTSPSGSTLLTNCQCLPGSEGNAGEICIYCALGSVSTGLSATVTCVLCEQGKYDDNNVCTDCPFGSSTLQAGSASVSACTCNAGFSATSTGPLVCEPCVPGSAKYVVGNSNCELCGENSYMQGSGAIECNPCPEGSLGVVTGATDIHSCVCESGFNTELSAGVFAGCIACNSDSFSVSGSVDVSTSGFTGAYATQTCQQCSAGQFVSGNTCLNCPSNSGADTPLISDGLCECDAGFQCEPNRYSTTGIVTTDGKMKYQILQTQTTSNGADTTTQTALVHAPLLQAFTVSWSATGLTHPLGLSISGTNWIEPSSEIAVVIIDTANQATTIVLLQDDPNTELFLICTQPAHNFEGVPVHVTPCPCIPCVPGFFKNDAGNDCLCGEYESGVCVRCVTGPATDRSCIACEDGFFSDSFGSTQCTQTPSGSYSVRGSASAQSCDSGATTLTARSKANDCVCEIGREPIQDSTPLRCSQCKPSYYKTGSDVSQCTKCPTGQIHSLYGEVDSSNCASCETGKYYVDQDEPECASCDALASGVDCECPPGYTGDGRIECIHCEIGTYKPIPGSAPCTSCPVGFGATDSTRRTSESDSCVACAAGTYIDGGSCKSCDDNKTSPIQSVSIYACVCDTGYEPDFMGLSPTFFPSNAVSTLQCSPCEQGFFKNAVGTAACAACTGNFYQALEGQLECIACPGNSVNANQQHHSLSFCKCPAGSTRTSAITSTDDGCTLCPEGSFASNIGDNFCSICPANSYFSKAGTGHHTDHCIVCTQNSNSPAGSQYSSSCACNAGYVADNAGGCTACGNSETEIDGVCHACPLNSHHLETASSTREHCICDNGYEWHGVDITAACVACPANTFCIAGVLSTCEQHLANSNTRTATAQTSAAACVCAAGYWRDDSESSPICTVCPPDSFCNNDQLTECPDNSVAVVLSSSVSDCLCETGFLRVDDECEACGANQICSGAEFEYDIDFAGSVVSMPTVEELVENSKTLLGDQSAKLISTTRAVNVSMQMPSSHIEITPDFKQSIDQAGVVPGYSSNSTLKIGYEFQVQLSDITPLKTSNVIKKSVEILYGVPLQSVDDIMSFSLYEITTVIVGAGNAPTPSPPPSAPSASFRRRQLLISGQSTGDSETSVDPGSTQSVQTILAYVQLDAGGLQEDSSDGNVILDTGAVQQAITSETTAGNSPSVSGSKLTVEATYEISNPDAENLLDAEQIIIIADKVQQSTSGIGNVETSEIVSVVQTVTSAKTQSVHVAQDISAESGTGVEFLSRGAALQTNLAISRAVAQSVATCYADDSGGSLSATVIGVVCTCPSGSYCSNSADTDPAKDPANGCTDTYRCLACMSPFFCTSNDQKQCSQNAEVPVAGASLAASCTCSVGYHQIDGNANNCVACGEQGNAALTNSFCAIVDSVSKATDCATVGSNFAMAQSQASSRDACVCKAGFFRLNNKDACKPCPLNFYCPGQTDLVTTTTSLNNVHPYVFACPEYAITHDTGKAALSDCHCRVGFKVTPNDEDGSLLECLQCDDDQMCQQTALEASSAVSLITSCSSGAIYNAQNGFCECDKGYGSISGQSTALCDLCPIGYFKNEPGNSVCLPCLEGTIAATVGLESCSSCGNKETSTKGASFCSCASPYVHDGTSCVECTGDTFFSATGATVMSPGTCIACPSNSIASITPPADVGACQCNAGYVRNEEYAFAVPEPDPISYVHDEAEIPVGCVCSEWAWDDGMEAGQSVGIPKNVCAKCNDLCWECPANTFQLNNDCVSCGSDATSPPGSSQHSDCVCDTGFLRLYEFDNNLNDVPQCIPVETSNDLACDICDAGNSKAGTGNLLYCEACALGSYQYEAGAAVCDACGADKNTHSTGQTYAGACECEPGFEMHICPDLMRSCQTAEGSCELCSVTIFDPSASSTSSVTTIPFVTSGVDIELLIDIHKPTHISIVRVIHSYNDLTYGAYIVQYNDGAAYHDCTALGDANQAVGDSKYFMEADCGSVTAQFFRVYADSKSLIVLDITMDGKHPQFCTNLAQSCGGAGSCTACDAEDHVATAITTITDGHTATQLTLTCTPSQTVAVRVDMGVLAYVDSVFLASMTGAKAPSVHVNVEKIGFSDVAAQSQHCQVTTAGDNPQFNCHHRTASFVWVFWECDASESVGLAEIEIFGSVDSPEHSWFPCSACAPGHFKGVLSNALCDACARDSYAVGTQNTECTKCKDTSDTLKIDAAIVTIGGGHDSPEDCTCDFGYRFDDSQGDGQGEVGKCMACEQGSYKDQKGELDCTLCGSSTHQHHYGRALPLPGIEAAHCKACPINSGQETNWPSLASDQFMDELTDCQCFKGFTCGSNCDPGPPEVITDSSSCEQCGDYKFKTLFGNQDCVFCQSNYYWTAHNVACTQCAIPQSDNSALIHKNVWNENAAGYPAHDWGRNVDDCQCNAGFIKAELGSPPSTKCKACSPGTFKPSLVDDFCTNCVQGKYQDLKGKPSCKNCPYHSNTFLTDAAADAEEHCVCNGGREWTASSSSCDQCGTGKFRADPFAAGAVHSCNAGSGVKNTDCLTCQDCTNTQYQDQTGQESCIECTDGLTTQEALTQSALQFSYANPGHISTRNHQKACICIEGYAGQDYLDNQVTWSAENPTKVHVEDSIYPLVCTECEVGYYSERELLNYYDTTYYHRVCRECPTHRTTSSTQSTTLGDCVCAAGYEPEVLGASAVDLVCIACPLGEFKSSEGNVACTPCSANPSVTTTQNTASTSSGDCQCAVSRGYTDFIQAP